MDPVPQNTDINANVVTELRIATTKEVIKRKGELGKKKRRIKIKKSRRPNYR